jgi:AcrR family transcriptional regulator
MVDNMNVLRQHLPAWGPDAAQADLTARARIGNAALTQFARHGYAGTSMRLVAEEAGVSVGLVQHHFGAKAGLREACDKYATEFVRLQTEAGIVDGRLAEGDFLSETYRAAPPVMAYLARALVDDSPGAASLFDYLVGIAEQHISAPQLPGTAGQTVNPRSVAAVLTAMKLGINLLHSHIARVIDSDNNTDGDEGWHEIGKALLAIVSPGISGPGISELAGKGLTNYESGHKSGDESTEEDSGD